jgi:formylglycine-generating enzyme required for sulfatase activity
MRDSTNTSDFEAYLGRWPSGIYAPLATNRLAALREAASAPPAADAARPREAGDVFRDCPTCPELVVIPGGEFLMGSDRRDDESFDSERPRHRVTVGGFALGVHEVTRDEYAAFVAATGRGPGDRCRAVNDDGRWEWRDEATWRSPGYSQAGDHPVVCVNWEDAQAYVDWLGEETGAEYRLPSESEWEYAARAGTTTRRHWGDDPDAGCAYANGADRTAKRRFDDWTVADCTDGVVWTSPVGAYRANAFGLHDTLGNVWEWVEDCWHENYARAPRDGSTWTTGGDCGRRVVRGGSWDYLPRVLRSASRNRIVAGYRNDDVGFRVARTLN